MTGSLVYAGGGSRCGEYLGGSSRGRLLMGSCRGTSRNRRRCITLRSNRLANGRIKMSTSMRMVAIAIVAVSGSAMFAERFGVAAEESLKCHLLPRSNVTAHTTHGGFKGVGNCIWGCSVPCTRLTTGTDEFMHEVWETRFSVEMIENRVRTHTWLCRWF